MFDAERALRMCKQSALVSLTSVVAIVIVATIVFARLPAGDEGTDIPRFDGPVSRARYLYERCRAGQLQIGNPAFTEESEFPVDEYLTAITVARSQLSEQSEIRVTTRVPMLDGPLAVCRINETSGALISAYYEGIEDRVGEVFSDEPLFVGIPVGSPEWSESEKTFRISTFQLAELL